MCTAPHSFQFVIANCVLETFWLNMEFLPTDAEQAVLPPKRSRTNKRNDDEVPNPMASTSSIINTVVHKFKQYHPGYSFRQENVLLLHQDGTCTTERAPLLHHGSWRILDQSKMLIEWNYKGDVNALRTQVVRKIDRTNCWELISTDSSWHYILIPIE